MLVLEAIEEEDVVLALASLYPDLDSRTLTEEERLRKDQQIDFNLAFLTEEIGNYYVYYHSDMLIAIYFKDVLMLFLLKGYVKDRMKQMNSEI